VDGNLWSNAMAKTAYLNMRVEPSLKANVEKVFDTIGVSTPDAITMFFRQVVMRKGIPFDVCIPNATTVSAMRELDSGRGKTAKSAKDAFDGILKE
jgi:DNA-damage-inducible protein J